MQAGAYNIATGGVSIMPAPAAAACFSTVTFLDGKKPVVCFTDCNRFVSIYQIGQPGVRVAINPGGYNEAFEREQVRRAQLAVTVENSTLFHESDPGQADVLVTDRIEVDHPAIIYPDLCAARVSMLFTGLEKAHLLRGGSELPALVNGWLANDITTGA